jgi:hypothetical protein
MFLSLTVGCMSRDWLVLMLFSDMFQLTRLYLLSTACRPTLWTFCHLVPVDSVPGGKVTRAWSWPFTFFIWCWRLRLCTATLVCSMALNNLNTRVTYLLHLTRHLSVWGMAPTRVALIVRPQFTVRHATNRTKWRSLCCIKLTQDFVHCLASVEESEKEARDNINK